MQPTGAFGIIYQVIHAVSVVLYGIFAAFFMYDPEGDFTVNEAIRLLMSNPCEIRQGMLGELMSPAISPVIGAVLMIIGAIILVLFFAGLVTKMFSTTIGAILRIAVAFRGALETALNRVTGGGGKVESDKLDIGSERAMASSASLTNGLALLIVGAMLTQTESNVVNTVIAALATIFSGVFMVVFGGAIFLINNVLGSALVGSQNIRPICGEAGLGLPVSSLPISLADMFEVLELARAVLLPPFL